METVSFATARRGIDQSMIAEAQKFLNRGYGFQNTARLTGINELTLREMCGRPKVRASVQVPKTRARLPRAKPAPVSLSCSTETEAIIRKVARLYGLTLNDMIGPNRTRFIAYARQEAMWTVRRQRPHLSLPVIGRLFGGRDRTTVLHALSQHEHRLAWAEAVVALSRAHVAQRDLFAEAA